MSHPTPAARRFYSAFYRWTISGSHVPSVLISATTTTACPTSAAHGRHRRRQHTQVAAPTDSHSGRAPSYDTAAPSESSSGHGRSSGISYKTFSYRGRASGALKDSDIEASTTRPVQTLEEVPYTALDAWDEVIRAKTGELLELEIALPLARWIQLKDHYGSRLGLLIGKSDGRVASTGRLWQKTRKDGQRMILCSVMVSGNFEQASRMKGMLQQALQTGVGEGEHAQRRESHPPLPWTRMERWVWQRVAPRSSVDLPSEEMPGWKEVFRARDVVSKSGIVEVAMPKAAWQALQEAGHDFETALQLVGVKVETVQKKAGSATDGDIEKKVETWLLSGSLERLAMAIKQFRSFQAHATDPAFAALRKVDGVSESSSPTTSIIRPVLLHANTTSPPPQTPPRFQKRTIPFPSLLIRYFEDRSGLLRATLKRITGIDSYCVLSGRPHPELLHIEITGPRSSCKAATAMINRRIRYAYQHAVLGAGYTPYLPSPKTFGIEPASLEQPLHYSKLRLTIDSQSDRIRDFTEAIHVKNSEHVLLLQLKTGCRIYAIDKGKGGWVVEGTPDSLEYAKKTLRNLLSEKAKKMMGMRTGELELSEVEHGEVTSGWRAGVWEVRKAKAADVIPRSIANAHTTDPEAGGSYKQALSRRSVVLSRTPSPQTAMSGQDLALSEATRAILRPLTHPVVLLTARHPSPATRESQTQPQPNVESSLEGCTGTTISSLTAVTLQPTPHFSFNLRLPSRTYEALARSRTCTIHILCASPNAAALAQSFTKGYERAEEPFHLARARGANVTSGVGGVGVEWEGVVGARLQGRLVRGAGGGVGDSVLIVVEIVGIEGGGKRVGEEGALAYSMRGYRGLGDEVAVEEVAELKTEEAKGSEKVDGKEMEGSNDEVETRGYSVGAGAAFSKLEDIEEEPSVAQTAKKSEWRSAVMEEEDDYDFGFGLRAGKFATSDGKQRIEIKGREEEQDIETEREAGGRSPAGTNAGAMSVKEADAAWEAATIASNTASEPKRKEKNDSRRARMVKKDDEDHGLDRTAGHRRDRTAMSELDSSVASLLTSTGTDSRHLLSAETLSPAGVRPTRSMKALAQHLHAAQASSRNGSSRSYSTSSSLHNPSQTSPSETFEISETPKPTSAPRSPDTLVAYPSQLSQPVSSFLNQPPAVPNPHGPNPVPLGHPPPFRPVLLAAIRLRRTIKQLRAGLAAGNLTSDRSLELETRIRTLNSAIVRAIGARAAGDLKLMLDRGGPGEGDEGFAGMAEGRVERAMADYADVEGSDGSGAEGEVYRELEEVVGRLRGSWEEGEGDG
ncbi:hypothetical protein B0A50_04024 [Salinomyces thailandicus]|uniref:Flavin reductase like domain-containing protein n=1 Tax=Salinomyces thailandicus TaxID=706561 RepID=A0A4U0TZN0_9PEZI|nr:hypothetical protein B0A50_04024 [Salinomyces thailandica]